jgi:dihydroorotate dehydrogenase
MIRTVRQAVGDGWPIIGVGGIASAEDAWEKLEAGATLIQAYSGFVFEGPSLTKQVVHGLSKRLKASQYASIADVIGTKSE